METPQNDAMMKIIPTLNKLHLVMQEAMILADGHLPNNHSALKDKSREISALVSELEVLDTSQVIHVKWLSSVKFAVKLFTTSVYHRLDMKEEAAEMNKKMETVTILGEMFTHEQLETIENNGIFLV